MVKLTTGEKIARDLCEMDATIGNAIEVDPVDVARRIDEAMLELSQQLAAEQLNNKLLRDALNQWIGIAANCSIESGCCCCGESIENHSHPMACGHSPVDMADSVVHSAIQKTDKALALPRDTSALDAYVAKRLHDMACDKGLLRIQVEELTRQRDLAVEALYESLECGEDGDWQSARRIIQSAIKESEK